MQALLKDLLPSRDLVLSNRLLSKYSEGTTQHSILILRIIKGNRRYGLKVNHGVS